MDNARCLEQPKQLSKQGRQAYRAIVDTLRKNKLDNTGGCKLFYSPKEWRERGEDYGTESELVLVYDGGDAYHVFNSTYMLPGLGEKVRNEIDNKLKEFGLYVEECTGWYAAVYPL